MHDDDDDDDDDDDGNDLAYLSMSEKVEAGPIVVVVSWLFEGEG